jgi:hypothetical protein
VEKIRRESMLGINHATRKEVVVIITGISLVSSPCCGVLTSVDISVAMPNLWLHLLVSDNGCNGPFACVGSQSSDASISVGFQSCNSEQWTRLCLDYQSIL